MILALFQSALFVLIASTAFSLSVFGFDRLAPQFRIRERHDLALAAVFTVPIIFLIAMTPARQGAVEAFNVSSAAVEPVAVIPPETLASLPASEWVSHDQGLSVSFILTGLGFVLVFVWMIGLVWAGLGLMRDLWNLNRLTGRAVPVSSELPLSHRVVLKTSADVLSPMVAGFVRPVILIPEGFRFDEAGEAVLEHEIAHIRRHDAMTGLAQRIIASVFWWAPGVHHLNRHVRSMREALCDQAAVRTQGKPLVLAHALLDAAQKAVLARPLTLAAQPPRKSELRFRVNALTQARAGSVRRSFLNMLIALPVLAALAIVFTPRVGAMDLLESRLIQAVRQGDVATLEARLERGADVNRIWPTDGTALIEASRRSDAVMVALLLDAGAEPDLVTRQSGTALIAAARAGSLDVVDLLLEAGAHIDLAAPQNGSPLINAARGGHVDIMTRLLMSGADPNGYVPSDETPLINAAAAGQIGAAELLVNAGADVSLTVPAAPGDFGGPYRSPLSEAKRHEQTAMEDWLVANGARHQPPETN
ncbi:M56 family metallopeptidase [Oceanicaulis alexandrii]|uniref:M56 family metallopeptidase n=1 Tax=Oceanicaulis alexandrii TaxID=153233 RepID=UPI002355E76F|nr:M56 family metallopeptidase [Oceanicaulis alexandrii]